MPKSLQEQLMGAGLVDKQKAKSIKKEKRNKRKQTAKGQIQKDELEQQQRLGEQKKQKLENDRELNLIKKQEQDKKEIFSQVKQLIQTNTIEREQGDVGFQFVDQNKIKKIHISEEQQKYLSKGLLAIVNYDDEYIFVPAAVAQKIKQRDADSIVHLQTKNESSVELDDEDPYKDYHIPDDLMW